MFSYYNTQHALRKYIVQLSIVSNFQLEPPTVIKKSWLLAYPTNKDMMLSFLAVLLAVWLRTHPKVFVFINFFGSFFHLLEMSLEMFS